MNSKTHCDAVINGIYYLQKCQLILKHFKDSHINEWLNELDETQKIFELNQTHHPLLEESMQFINAKIIHPFLNILEQITQITLENYYLEINYVIRRLQLIREFMPNISQVPLNDVFCQRNWERLSKYIEFVNLDDPLVIEKQFADFNDYISVGCAYAKLGNMIKLPVLSMVFQNLGGAFLLANIQKARQIKLREMTNPTVDFIQNLWSIQDRAPVLKSFMKCSMTKINSHHKIYIPYLFEPTFTLEKINQEIKEGSLYKMEKFQGFDMIEENLFENVTQSLFIKDRQKRIKVRVLSANKNIFKPIDQEGLVKQISFISNQHHHIFSNIPVCNQKITKIILQIHGGGWIGMSSFSHQTYTRKWANHIGDDCVIFSVDYRLAPKYPYPYALEDVWQLYLWILYFSQYFMNISLKELIIAGDSAGGNMALGICFRSIKLGIRVPDGLFLPYPVVNLNFKSFNPYLLNGLVDQIAPTTILVVVLKEYLKSGQEQPEVDPYLSPLIADNQFLMKLPPIRIICGGKDSLTGDTIRFVNKMRFLNHDTQIKVYNGLSHGFMNFEVPIVGVTQIGQVVNSSSQMVKDLFNIINHPN